MWPARWQLDYSLVRRTSHWIVVWVFNIQQLEAELRPLAIHLIAGFVWNRVRRDRRPRLLVIDEAWSLLPYEEGDALVSSMARRARKYYRDWSPSPRTPLTSCVVNMAAPSW